MPMLEELATVAPFLGLLLAAAILLSAWIMRP